jgi:hypothetical protein
MCIPHHANGIMLLTIAHSFKMYTIKCVHSHCMHFYPWVFLADAWEKQTRFQNVRVNPIFVRVSSHSGNVKNGLLRERQMPLLVHVSYLSTMCWTFYLKYDI